MADIKFPTSFEVHSSDLKQLEATYELLLNINEPKAFSDMLTTLLKMGVSVDTTRLEADLQDRYEGKVLEALISVFKRPVSKFFGITSLEGKTFNDIVITTNKTEFDKEVKKPTNANKIVMCSEQTELNLSKKGSLYKTCLVWKETRISQCISTLIDLIKTYSETETPFVVKENETTKYKELLPFKA